LNHEISEKELNEAKFLIFQDLDAPTTPSMKAYSQFTFGLDDSFKQKRRDIILDAQKKDLIRVCEQFLSKPEFKSTSILGSLESIPEEIKNSKEWNKQ
jgi:Zn-dependent M16 (insulinase) family peptidase